MAAPLDLSKIDPCEWGSILRSKGSVLSRGGGGEYPGMFGCNDDPLDSCGRPCTKEYNFVCGSNGKKYDNPCLLNIAQCRAKKNGNTLTKVQCKRDPCKWQSVLRSPGMKDEHRRRRGGGGEGSGRHLFGRHLFGRHLFGCDDGQNYRPGKWRGKWVKD